MVRILKQFFVVLLCFGISAGEQAFAKPPKQVDVVIVGAGLSGLATAYGLKKAGVSYHIIEIGPRVGGRVRTVRYDRAGKSEIRVDSGMEEYWESNPAVQILKELKLDVSSDVAISSIVLGGKLFPLGDEEAAEFQKKIFTSSEIASLKAFKQKVTPWVHELTSGKPVRADLFKMKDVSFAQFVQGEKLPQKVSEWIRISLECEIGTHWDRISALDGLAEFHIFLGEGEKCYRVKGGNDHFTDGMAKAVGLKNISLNQRVTRIASKNGMVTVNYLDTQTNTNGVVKAKHVVNTIPLYRLFEVQFEPALSEKKRQAIQSMTWGSYFKVHVFLNPSADRFWNVNGNTILPILSDSSLGVIYEGTPDAGKNDPKIVSLLVHGDTAERYNLMPLDVVRAELMAAFDKLWPGFSKEVHDVEFYRYHPRAIAAWPVGRSRFDDLSNEIRRPENGIYFAGDFTESSHSDGAFISAARVVKQIVEKKK